MKRVTTTPSVRSTAHCLGRARRLAFAALALAVATVAHPAAASSDAPPADERRPALAASGALAAGGTAPVHGAVRPGMAAPEFELPDLDGETRRLSDYAGGGQIVVIEWYNPTCVYIVKYHETHSTMRDLRARFGADQGVVWLAVNSGSVESGTADPALNKERAEAQGIAHPILLDPDGEVGRLYGARVTPQFFVLDGDGVVRWVGPVDNDPSLRWLGRRTLLADALAALTAGSDPAPSPVQPFGCAVKYSDTATIEVETAR